MRRVAVIGSGIAGQMIIHHLLEKSHFKAEHFAIDWISADDFAPACSQSSTSVVRRAGIQREISPLGDLLVDSFEAFESFYKKNSTLHAVIEKAYHYESIVESSPKLDQFKKRFPHHMSQNFLSVENSLQSVEPAYIVEPEHLKNQIIKNFNQFSHNCIRENLYIDSKKLESLKGQFDFIFIATGHQHKTHFRELPLKEELSGHYIDMDSHFLPCELQQSSWSYSINGVNLIFRKKTNRLLISAFNVKDSIFLATPQALRDLYKEAQNIFSQWSWPQLQYKNLQVGVRVKGVKRMPCALWHDQQVASLNGLYKNGFSFAVKLADDLTKKCF